MNKAVVDVDRKLELVIKQGRQQNENQAAQNSIMKDMIDGLDKYRDTMGGSVIKACDTLITIGQNQERNFNQFISILKDIESKHNKEIEKLCDLTAKLTDEVRANTSVVKENMVELRESKKRVDNIAVETTKMCKDLTEVKMELVEIKTKSNTNWSNFGKVAIAIVTAIGVVSAIILGVIQLVK